MKKTLNKTKKQKKIKRKIKKNLSDLEKKLLNCNTRNFFVEFNPKQQIQKNIQKHLMKQEWFFKY